MTSRLLLPALALGLLSGCDAADPAAGLEAPSGHAFAAADGASASWTIQEILDAAVGLGLGDSLDLFVTFTPGTDPEAGSDEVFDDHDIRRRGYVQETAPGVAAAVGVLDLPGLLELLFLSPIVADVEIDLPIDLDPFDDSYVPLSHDYTGGPGDVVVAQTTDPGEFQGQMLPWSVRFIRGHRSRARSGNGEGTVDVDVYVIDSGVDHPDVTVVEAVDFLEAGADPGPTTHGNHVAGIIAAADDDGGMVGIAPGARVHSLDVFDASGTTTMSQVLRAVDHVVAAKRASPSTPMLVNMSLGARTETTELNALDRAIRLAIREGIVFVVSAGNDGTDAATVTPARVPEALTVGAYGADRRFAASFSNHGPVVDLLAPGVRVVSAADGGQYATLDGTSMAAPHAAGVAALYMNHRPRAKPRRVVEAVIERSRRRARFTPPNTTDRSAWAGDL